MARLTVGEEAQAAIVAAISPAPSARTQAPVGRIPTHPITTANHTASELEIGERAALSAAAKRATGSAHER